MKRNKEMKVECFFEKVSIETIILDRDGQIKEITGVRSLLYFPLQTVKIV